MKRCIEIAQKGKEKTFPNPLVGCVITHKGKIISEGFHEKYGENHAEVNAINNVKNKKRLQESTLYVNLEPCCHYGKTPPCTDLIIKNKIPKVVIGCYDISDKVAGKGIQKMIDAGIKVETNILNKKSKDLNKRFLTFHNKERPYIILKWAKSIDNFIAPINQTSPFWMSSEKSKSLVHKWRGEETAILVGRITVIKDNPLLTVREVKGRNPIRIVIDKDLKLTKELNLFNNDSQTFIINSIKNKSENLNHYIKLDFNNFMNNLMKALHKRNIYSLLVEGGSKTLQSFINSGIWDEARIFTCKKHLVNGVKSPKIQGKSQEIREINNDTLEILIN